MSVLILVPAEAPSEPFQKYTHSVISESQLLIKISLGEYFCNADIY